MKAVVMGFLYGLVMFCTNPVRAEHILFYQPLNVDSALTSEQWKYLWRESRRHGADRVIVQWTRHGESDFGGAQGWLMNALRYAHGEGLELILGLTYDPAYYNLLGNGPEVPYRWHQWLAQAQQQQHWLSKTVELPIAGWYIPMELDDENYRDPALRTEIIRQLSTFSEQTNLPVHLSAFSAGKLAPTVYAPWLDQLQKVLQVWWQDGAGTASLPQPVRYAYEAALPCQIGIVREAFLVKSKIGEPFRAEPIELQLPSEMQCHPQAVFSLRYRPWGKILLDNQRATESIVR